MTSLILPLSELEVLFASCEPHVRLLGSSLAMPDRYVQASLVSSPPFS